MAKEVLYISDPLGHVVCLSKEMLHLEEEKVKGKELYDDLPSVIRKPAMIIASTDNPSEIYYFRSLDWQFSVLMKTKLIEDIWHVYDCIINPPDQYVVDLLEKGKLLK